MLSFEAQKSCYVRNGSLIAAFGAGCASALAAEAYVHTTQRTRKLSKMLSPHLLFFPSHLLLATHLPSYTQLSSSLSFHQVVINQS